MKIEEVNNAVKENNWKLIFDFADADGNVWRWAFEAAAPQTAKDKVKSLSTRIDQSHAMMCFWLKSYTGLNFATNKTSRYERKSDIHAAIAWDENREMSYIEEECNLFDKMLTPIKGKRYV